MDKHNDNAYFLLAVIDNSCGRIKQSEDLLRKTLYLNPKHHDALIHLALLLESKGDHKAAQHLIERAKSIQAMSYPPTSKQAKHQ